MPIAASSGDVPPNRDPSCFPREIHLRVYDAEWLYMLHILLIKVVHITRVT